MSEFYNGSFAPLVAPLIEFQARSARCAWLTADEVLALPPTTWVIEDVLPKGGLGVLYGAPGIGKSLLALGWACSVSGGHAWNGLHVVSGAVRYVAAEGVGSLGQRIQAWLDHNSPLVGDIKFKTDPFNLLSDSPGRFIAEIAASNVKLIVFDTLAMCMAGGDENGAKDMSVVVDTCNAIRRRTGATILLLHHEGKRGGVERGSNALRAAADTMMNLRRAGSGLLLKCDKQRDKAPLAPIELRLISMDGGAPVVVPSNKAVHSDLLAALAAGPVGREDLVRKLGGRAQTTRELIDTAVADQGVPITEVKQGRRRVLSRTDISNISSVPSRPSREGAGDGM